MKVRVIIVDDEPNAIRTLENFLAKYIQTAEVVGTANGCATATELMEQTEFDVVLLDINLGDGSGFDVLDRTSKENFHVVFTTAYDQYAIKAFKYAAMDYLLKPINPEELIATFERLQGETVVDLKRRSAYAKDLSEQGAVSKLVINSSNEIHFLEIDQISRMESFRNYTDIFLVNGQKITSTKTLKHYEQLLVDSGFFRIHQKHLARLSAITRFLKEDGGYVLLNDGSKLEVSRRKKDELLKQLMPDG